MALSDFLNSYTSISPYSLFFSLFFLCSHYVHVVQKNVTGWTEKKVLHRSYIARQNYVSQRNML